MHGAAVANYASVEGLSRAGARVSAAGVRDLLANRSFELRARTFVNAAGPWVDDIRRMDERDAKPSVRLTKGAHLVFPASAIPVRESLVLADEGERIVFVMPHDTYVLIGTTDTDFSCDSPQAPSLSDRRRMVSADPGDVEYLLAVLARSLPSIKLSAEDVASSFAGLRALVTDGEAKPSPSSVPREEVILESASGMFSVAGGKLTTHRAIAEKVVDGVLRAVGRGAGASPTRTAKFPGARMLDGDESAISRLDGAIGGFLIGRYGTRAEIVARIASERPELAAPLAPGCPALRAEVVHAIRNEMANCLADFMVRRTSLVWRYPMEAEAAAPVAARIMAAELGWSRAREETELAGFVADLKRRRAA